MDGCEYIPTHLMPEVDSYLQTSRVCSARLSGLESSALPAGSEMPYKLAWPGWHLKSPAMRPQIASATQRSLCRRRPAEATRAPRKTRGVSVLARQDLCPSLEAEGPLLWRLRPSKRSHRHCSSQQECLGPSLPGILFAGHGHPAFYGNRFLK